MKNSTWCPCSDLDFDVIEKVSKRLHGNQREMLVQALITKSDNGTMYEGPVGFQCALALPKGTIFEVIRTRDYETATQVRFKI